MDVYLYGSDAPPLMHSFDIAQKVFHRRVGLDVHHTFTDGAAPLTDMLLAFLVRNLHVLLLHRPASLLLHHALGGINISIISEPPRSQRHFHIQYETTLLGLTASPMR